MVGGLCLSQLLTLFITPVIYIYLDKVDRMLKRRLEPQLEEVPELHPRPDGGGGGVVPTAGRVGVLRGHGRDARACPRFIMPDPASK